MSSDQIYPFKSMQLYCAYSGQQSLKLIDSLLEEKTSGYHLIRCDYDYKSSEEGERTRTESNRLVIGLLPADYARVHKTYGDRSASSIFWIVPYRIDTKRRPIPEKHEYKIVVYIDNAVPQSVAYLKLQEVATKFFGRPEGFSLDLPVSKDGGKMLDKHQGHAYISIKDPSVITEDDLVALRILLNNYSFNYTDGTGAESSCMLTTSWYFKKQKKTRFAAGRSVELVEVPPCPLDLAEPTIEDNPRTDA